MHLHKVHKQAELICAVRNQNSGYPYGSEVTERVLQVRLENHVQVDLGAGYCEYAHLVKTHSAVQIESALFCIFHIKRYIKKVKGGEVWDSNPRLSISFLNSMPS